MNRFLDKLLNVLLLPAGFYKKLGEKRFTLYAGIVIVGILDIFFPDFIKTFQKTFTGKTAGNLQFNILLSAVLVIGLGVIDVLFFTIPLFDFFKFLKKKEDKPFTASPIKAMKVYIMSNLILFPVTVILNYVFFNSVGENSSALVQNISLAYLFIILIWQSAIVTRGLNALFDFNPLFRRLTFIIVFTWTYIFSIVFGIQIVGRLLLLLK